jgi:hypothetical protein
MIVIAVRPMFEVLNEREAFYSFQSHEITIKSFCKLYCDRAVFWPIDQRVTGQIDQTCLASNSKSENICLIIANISLICGEIIVSAQKKTEVGRSNNSVNSNFSSRSK